MEPKPLISMESAMGDVAFNGSVISVGTVALCQVLHFVDQALREQKDSKSIFHLITSFPTHFKKQLKKIFTEMYPQFEEGRFHPSGCQIFEIGWNASSIAASRSKYN